MDKVMTRIAQVLLPAVLLFAAPASAGVLTQEQQARLLAAYPDHLQQIEGNTLIWQDGTRMPIDDGSGDKSIEQWLARPDVEDMLMVPYPLGDLAAPPSKDVDPGRARNTAFFDKVYGNCSKGEVSSNLETVVWLPKKSGQPLRFNKANGAAEALREVSRELDALPARFDRYLYPSAGTYNCRKIAGTDRVSAHGHGIAIDINTEQTDYWRWNKPRPDGSYAYKNKIPAEIVEIFEKHGFIWGGKWHHYDTMHFEYRPELAGGGG
jgi:D-alanyl-D-alanine carboxypeptidase-like protein